MAKNKKVEKTLQEEMNDLNEHIKASKEVKKAESPENPLDSVEEVYETSSLKETAKLAKEFAHRLNGGEVVLLFGDMGSGKTTFTKDVIKRLGFKGVVTSPTFTIMQQYFVRKFKLIHYDLYRMEASNEGYNFGLEENIRERDINTIVFVEWPEKITKLLKGDFVVVKIEKNGEESSKFTISNERV